MTKKSDQIAALAEPDAHEKQKKLLGFIDGDGKETPEKWGAIRDQFDGDKSPEEAAKKIRELLASMGLSGRLLGLLATAWGEDRELSRTIEAGRGQPERYATACEKLRLLLIVPATNLQQVEALATAKKQVEAEIQEAGRLVNAAAKAEKWCWWLHHFLPEFFGNEASKAHGILSNAEPAPETSRVILDFGLDPWKPSCWRDLDKQSKPQQQRRRYQSFPAVSQPNQKVS